MEIRDPLSKTTNTHQTEYDVWRSDDGRWKCTKAVSPFVDHDDAPYTFSEHVQRVFSSSARSALNSVRSQALNG